MVPRHDPYDRRVVIAIDVGNSAVKVARVVRGEVVEVTRLADRVGAGSGGPSDACWRADDGAIAMVSVVPGWSTAIEEVAARQPGRPLLLATHRTIPSRSASRSRSSSAPTGCWAPGPPGACVGAPCIVVDVGTATTIDVVDADGAFVGWRHPAGPCAGHALARARHGAPAAGAARAPRRVPSAGTPSAAIASGVILGHREAIGGSRRAGWRTSWVATGDRGWSSPGGDAARRWGPRTGRIGSSPTCCCTGWPRSRSWS